MFSRQDFAGLGFEDLLKDLVPPNTLATAMKYIKLLWGERAHENLMKSINPLGQLEITMDNGHGGKETRYLQFDFHRVMGPRASSTSCAPWVTSPPACCSPGAAGVAGKRERSARHDARHDARRSVAADLVPRQHRNGLQLINAILKEPAAPIRSSARN